MVAGREAGRPVTGEAKTAFLQTWGEHLQAIHALHMTFTQEKHLRLLRRPLVTQGELWLKDDVLYYVLKNTAGETELELRLDSHAVKTYYPLLQTLEVIDLHGTQAPPPSIPFMWREPDTLVKAYEIEIFMASELYTLQLTPKKPTSPVREIRLTLKDFQPQTFRQIEKNGNRLEMRISAFTPNPKISQTQLKLHIPEGTKVIYPLK